MGKLDRLKSGAGGHAAESMGSGVTLGLIVPETSGKPAHLEGITRSKNLVEIAVGQIVRDETQPREHFDETEMDALVESITARGILQPIRVRWDGTRYVIVAGERRFRAARQAGLKNIPCMIHDGTITESTVLQEQLVENLLRADLQPIETAKAYRRLMDLEGWSSRQLGRELHVPDSTIVRSLALLELPADVQGKVEAGEIAPSVAYEVSKLATPEAQTQLAERIVREKLTRADVIAKPKKEFKVLGGKVTVTGIDDTVAALKAALKQAQKDLAPG